MSEHRTSSFVRKHPARDGQTAIDRIDGIDRQVVAELRRDGRLSMRALADRVHVSRASVYTRVERLRAAGVITGFTATVDPERLGLGTSAHVSVSIEQNSWREAATALRALPGVERVSLVGADFDVLVLVRARDNHELRDLVLERIQAVPAVKSTRTWLIFDEIEGIG